VVLEIIDHIGMLRRVSRYLKVRLIESVQRAHRSARVLAL
jgi:hypothetical protein